jgi:hypothetical protein
MMKLIKDTPCFDTVNNMRIGTFLWRFGKKKKNYKKYLLHIDQYIILARSLQDHIERVDNMHIFLYSSLNTNAFLNISSESTVMSCL